MGQSCGFDACYAVRFAWWRSIFGVSLDFLNCCSSSFSWSLTSMAYNILISLLMILASTQMVRVLVATSIREAAAGAEEDALLKLMDATCRRATAPPAPPDGLCLVDVGYTDFDPQNCFIRWRRSIKVNLLSSPDDDFSFQNRC